MQTALAISGSDPTGGAGLQADLQVFRALGVHGAGVLSALTLQDSLKVHRVLPVFPSVVLDQIRVLLADIRPAAVKIGMLGSDDVVRNVAIGLASLPDEVPIVVDPVLLASDGTVLLERRAWPTLEGLFARAALVTPNLFEAEALTGREGNRRVDGEEAARILIGERGARAVLLKGGHRQGAPDDLLAIAGVSGPEFHWLEGVRIEGAAPHGTGCALASAITAHLARGIALPEAVASSRRFVAEAIGRAFTPGHGAPFLGFP